MSLLVFENVAREAPGAPRPLVEGISFALERGECVALEGRSGAGKTTLLHLAAGLMRATRGRVLFDGVDLAAAPEADVARLRAGRLGLVFQNNLSLPALTTIENAALPLRLAGLGRGEAHRRADEMLARVGLGELAGARTAALSGGQRRRLGMARALLGRPDLLLADEPTADLDEATGADIEQVLFAWLRESGAAALIVTHDPELVRATRRVLTLDAGRLVV